MVTLDEAINEIDSYIKTIIQDMINFRSKRLDASIKVLNKLKEVMDTVLYTYRVGQLYDKAIKIERPALKQFDVVKPSLQLKYTGGKTRLYTDSAYIDVPSVPVFVFEPISPNYATLHAGTEVFKKHLALKFPINAEIEELPDVENAYGKYYFFEDVTYVPIYKDFTSFSGKRITLMGMIMEINLIATSYYYNYIRYLTYNGVQHLFYVNVYLGRVIATTTTVSGQEIDNVEYPCTLFEFVTSYPEDVNIIIFGNEYRKGEVINDLWYKYVLMIIYNGVPTMYELN